MSPTEKGQYFLAQLRIAVAVDHAARPPSLVAWQRSIQALGETLVDADLIALDELMLQEQEASTGPHPLPV